MAQPFSGKCFRCRESGHTSQNCPQGNARSNDFRYMGQGQCRICGLKDHQITSCPKMPCDRCTFEGHVPRNCPSSGQSGSNFLSWLGVWFKYLPNSLVEGQLRELAEQFGTVTDLEIRANPYISELHSKFAMVLFEKQVDAAACVSSLDQHEFADGVKLEVRIVRDSAPLATQSNWAAALKKDTPVEVESGAAVEYIQPLLPRSQYVIQRNPPFPPQAAARQLLSSMEAQPAAASVVR